MAGACLSSPPPSPAPLQLDCPRFSVQPASSGRAPTWTTLPNSQCPHPSPPTPAPPRKPETLYLTVNLIDRFLEAKQVTRKHLQLVGVTAMLVASKYEEIWAPEVRDFVYISDRAYTRDQILNMEKIMLNCLRFNLTVPSECGQGRQGE